MSIEVQCPNPDCAKVHRVKNRWAGRRGTCPDCGTIIKVPAREEAAAMAAQDRATARTEHETTTIDEEAAAAALADFGDETEEWQPPKKKKPAADDLDEDDDEKPVRARDDEDEEEAVRARDEEDDDEEPAPKRKAAALDDDEDDEEPAPKRKAAALEDDEDEEPVRAHDEEEDDEEPAPKRKAAAFDDDEDEEPAPKRKAAALDDDQDEEPVQAEDEDERPRPKRKAAALDDDEDDGPVRAEDDDDDGEPRPRKKPARRGREDEDEDFDDEAKPAASGRRFGLLLILVYLLATLSILGVFTLSFVEPVQILVNGKAVGAGPERVSLLRSVSLEEPKGTDSSEIKTVLLAAPIGTAVLAGLALLVSLLKRNFGLLALIIAYLVVIPCWAMSVLLGIGRMARDHSEELIKSHFTQRPDVVVSDPSGIWFWVGLGSAVAATVLFGLSILLIHRRTWARIVSVILGVLAWGGGVAFVMFGKNM